MEVASSPHDFKLMLEAGGARASGIEQMDAGAGAKPDSEPDPSSSRTRVGAEPEAASVRRSIELYSAFEAGAAPSLQTAPPPQRWK